MDSESTIGRCTQPANSQLIPEQYETPGVIPLSLAERAGLAVSRLKLPHQFVNNYEDDILEMLLDSDPLKTDIATELIDLLGDSNLMDVFCEDQWCHIKRNSPTTNNIFKNIEKTWSLLISRHIEHKQT